MAVEVARRCRIPLKIAAKIDPAYDQNYHQRFEPFMNDPIVEFLSEVDEAGKDQLLRGALALLFPSCWPEPFGMVMVEAMVCAVPVIGLRYGAVPEVIIDGKTGFICNSVDEVVAAVRRLGEIERTACHRHVEVNFSAKAMADGYEAAYQLVLSEQCARKSNGSRCAARQGRSEAAIPSKRPHDRRVPSLDQHHGIRVHGHCA